VKFSIKAKHFLVIVGMVLVAIICCFASLSTAVAESPLQGKNIAMVIGFMGYDTSELYEPKETFEAQGGVVHI
jgi:hypothetical protein